MMRVADYIVERLYDQGAKRIFMVTGRGTLFLSDAVARHAEIGSVCVHHEQAAAFSAMGYSQATQGIGACLVSTGCASTNAITGLLCAWQDDVPCVFVSGQNKLDQTVRHTGLRLRTFGQQECDILSVVEPLTNYAAMIDDPRRIACELDRAFHLATSGRRGPVWLDVPLDVQNMRVEPDELERFAPTAETAPAPSEEDLRYVIEALGAASRPVLLIGSGVRSAGAVKELERFAEHGSIPVTFASSAVDAYGAGRKLGIGAAGSLGASRAGNFTVQNADLLIVLGCRLSPVTTGEEYDKFAREAKIIVVDIDPVEHSKNTVRIDRLIHADARRFMQEMLRRDFRGAGRDWVEKCLHWKRTFPKCEAKYRATERVDLHYLGDCLTQVLPDDGLLVTDAGLTELILPATIAFREQQRCLHPASQGAMGYALPAAVGACFAQAGTVIAAIGDGSIMMNLQELETIRFHRLPIKILVINNNLYAVIRRRQTELFRRRTIGTDPDNGVSCPDFSKVADAFGISYARIDSGVNLEEALLRIIASRGPILCEIMSAIDQEYIASSFTHNAARRVVRRPLEDQAPFMERDLFLSEMVVAPIDQ